MNHKLPVAKATSYRDGATPQRIADVPNWRATLELWCSIILDGNIIVAAGVIAPAIGYGAAAYR